MKGMSNMNNSLIVLTCSCYIPIVSVLMNNKFGIRFNKNSIDQCDSAVNIELVNELSKIPILI